jgi:hypothetical protein
MTHAAGLLKVIAGTIHAQPKTISFRCAGEGGQIDCQMTAAALRDLLEFHRLNFSNEGAFETLLPEIERLVNSKFNAGRFDENGELWIRVADLLRYGYSEQNETAA